MPAQKLLARVTLASRTGLVEDEWVNDWAFEFTAGGMDQSDADQLATLLRDDVYALAESVSGKTLIANFLSKEINPSVDAVVDIYDVTAHLNGVGVGSPIFTSSFPVDDERNAGLSSLPSEVAFALSFHADLTGVLERSGATRPASRRRGRIFFGPLSPTAVALDSNQVAHPHGDLIELGTQIGEALMGEVSFVWSVWSRADAAFREVVGGYADNAFDTQRRRGEKATSRSTFSI